MNVKSHSACWLLIQSGQLINWGPAGHIWPTKPSNTAPRLDSKKIHKIHKLQSYRTIHFSDPHHSWSHHRLINPLCSFCCFSIYCQTIITIIKAGFIWFKRKKRKRCQMNEKFDNELHKTVLKKPLLVLIITRITFKTWDLRGVKHSLTLFCCDQFHQADATQSHAALRRCPLYNNGDILLMGFQLHTYIFSPNKGRRREGWSEAKRKLFFNYDKWTL